MPRTSRHLPDMSADAFLERAAVPANELREALLSFLVHEIRNPLASMLWSVEMLARKPSGDARSDRLAQLALRSARRLRALLEDMFALERLPARVAPGRVDLREAVIRALSPHDLEPEGITAELGEAPEGLIVPLDPTVFDRLLHACLRRAVRAGEGGPIHVEAVDEGSTAVVTIVRDGATSNDLDPPVLSPGGSEGAGTTFALYVARFAAQRLGVELWTEDLPDGGARIGLRIPLERKPH